MSDQTLPPVKFSLSFTPDIDKYIAIYQKQGKKPTIAGFANRIGVDDKTIWAWANKKKKDDKGNTTDELARPNFNAAVKRLEALGKEPAEEKLNEKQELFCLYYASDKEFFGNGTQAYIEAYQPDQTVKGWYSGVRASASRLLTNANILKRINELLETDSLNDAFVDKQLRLVITQNADFPSKVAAIREYNKLKARIIDKIDHTTKGREMPTPIYGGKATSN